MITTIQKWGNSQGVRLPKNILENANMLETFEVEIISEKNNIIIRPLTVKKKHKCIQELFAGYDEEYKTKEIDWGSPKGDEIW